MSDNRRDSCFPKAWRSVRAPAQPGCRSRTTVTLHGASAATLPETLPRILRMAELEKTVVEGAAAAPLAAFLAGKLPELAGKRVALVVCGGNIDPAVLSRVIEIGLVADGRIARFTAVISDRPGGLAALSRVVAECGASIKDIFHDRAFSGPDVAAVRCVCTVETRDHAHVRELRRVLRRAGFQLSKP